MSCESHEAQDKVSDLIDTAEAAILGLTEAVAENRTLITENSEQIAENRKLITENRELILENSRKLDALIAHLDVHFKPPAGFLKE